MTILANATPTILDHLGKIYPDSSNRTLRNLLKNERVKIGDVVIKNPKTPLEKGQKVTILPKKNIVSDNIEILFEDDYTIIIQKPPGLLSVPLDDKKEKNVLQILRKEHNTHEIYAAHRIDREASGILLFTKGRGALEAYKELFFKHDIIREYIAICQGHVTPKKGTWQSYLKEMPNKKVTTGNESDGEFAITHYDVAHFTKKSTCLILTLHTGKKHQIRVQCASNGHPILGDSFYGGKKEERLYLHAYKLSFIHPFTKKRLLFTTPLPACFAKYASSDMV